ncbi:BrxE family protein [[Mycobacterium] burgundiense]|uniref:BrxE family protein n=1 Tax=[Mycobacterium] burgundiense TaxID=3064286 RepID=A0ABM9LLN3_9MYCO|nr:BrxE family protein [Mycolicibacterium sp. MU0053]CAJ1501179.1 BrxE family protein [Mycolicibacterium sp. MU0053]
MTEAIRLVLGIARLGEQGLRGWWRSHGLGKGGQYVLSTAFPRTAKSAALELDIVSAARRHDDLLGRQTALHLFSSAFPFRRWAEAWLAEQKTLAPDALFDVLVSWDLENALTSLRDWAGDAPVGEPIGEGLLLGQLTDEELMNDESSLTYAKLLAAAYLAQDSNLRPPYFDLKH